MRVQSEEQRRTPGPDPQRNEFWEKIILFGFRTSHIALNNLHPLETFLDWRFQILASQRVAHTIHIAAAESLRYKSGRSNLLEIFCIIICEC